MIRASGEPVRGPAFKSRFGPFFFFSSIFALDTEYGLERDILKVIPTK